MADAPDYGPLFQASGQTHDIDPLLLQAIQMHEDAGGDPHAVGPPNKSGELARGVMQFLPSTAAQYGVNPDDPGSAILGAGAYLAKLRQDHNDDLRAMLAQYGGGGATAYADKVLNTYRQLQQSWGIKPGGAAPDDAAQPPASSPGADASFTMNPAQPETPREQAFSAQQAQQAQQTPIRPKGAQGPDYFAKSVKPGSQAEQVIPPVGETTGTGQPPPDFNTQVFGPAPAAPSAPAAGSAAAPAATPSATAPDFHTQVFGPAATPTPTPTPTQAEGQPPPALTTPPQPSWWQSNVANPVAAMYNPTQGEPLTDLLGQPFLQNLGAGVFQGARNVAQRANEFLQYGQQQWPQTAALDTAAATNPLLARPFANVPILQDTPGVKDISLAQTPEQTAATGKRLADETAAYKQRYGDSNWAGAGELAGNLLATYPLGAFAWGARGLGAALPFLRGTGEVATAAGVPAAQNVLTTPGQDWRQAAEQGGLGGLVVHGALGSVAGQLAPEVASQAVQDARRLGFDLTTGEAAGGLAKNIEDVTQYLPFSGAAGKVAEHRAVINRVLNRNMGMPESPVLTQATMQTAIARAKNLMDQIQNVTVDANRDPKLLTELGDIHSAASAQPMTGSSITGAVDDILTTAANNGGQIPGSILHNLIKAGTPLDRLTESPDGVIRQFAERIKTSLQDAASRTNDPNIYGQAQAAANGQAVADLNNGRYFWKTIETVKPLVNKTGTADDASYAGLAQRIEGTAKNPNFDPQFSGQNHDMDTLARVLRGPLAELKSSGTGRQMITANLLGLGGEGGLGAATAIFRPENFGTYLSTVVAPTLAAIGAGRLSRYGPSLGSNAIEAARREFNPLLPRIAAPAVGTNPLLTLPSPQPGQP
jgi:hypothetical protein